MTSSVNFSLAATTSCVLSRPGVILLQCVVQISSHAFAVLESQLVGVAGPEVFYKFHLYNVPPAPVYIYRER